MFFLAFKLVWYFFEMVFALNEHLKKFPREWTKSLSSWWDSRTWGNVILSTLVNNSWILDMFPLMDVVLRFLLPLRWYQDYWFKTNFNAYYWDKLVNSFKHEGEWKKDKTFYLSMKWRFFIKNHEKCTLRFLCRKQC